MKIAIIGTGNIGSSLGKQWGSRGHQIMFGVRNPEDGQAVASSIAPNATVGTVPEAAAFGEVVVLAVPGAAAAEAVRAAGSLAGKVVIDCTNAVTWRTPEGPALTVGGTTSQAEEIAKLATGAHVVKAFNTTYAALLRSGGQFGSQKANVFYCGDDAAAKAKVARLAEEMGFEPVDLGPLRMARLLEPFALIMIQLQGMPGMSSDMGYRLLRR